MGTGLWWGGLEGTVVVMDEVGRGLGAGVLVGMETRHTLVCRGCMVVGAGGGGGGEGGGEGGEGGLSSPALWDDAGVGDG